MRALVAALAILLISFGWSMPASAREEVTFPTTDHLSGSADELAGWFAVSDGKWVRAREIGEKIVREHPSSFAGHYVLGVAWHYGEGDLARSLYHLEIATSLFESLYGATPDLTGPWRWHEATLREIAFTLGEMDRPEPELKTLDKYDLAYSPKRIAQRVWPLMKLRRFDESRKAARDAVSSGNAQQRVIARSDLCAAECEAGDRRLAFAACTDALADFRKAGSGGQVEYSNASEAALSVFRYDDCERFLKEATVRATPDSWGNPFQHLAELYLVEARVPEAIAALRGAQDLRTRREAWLDQHGEARLDGTLSELFLLVGVTDRAVSAAERAVVRPDRQGVHSGTEAQAEAASAIRYAAALHELAVHEEEQVITSGWVDAMKLRVRARWHRIQAWRARRQAAVMLADEAFLVRSMRPYYVGGIDLPMWFIPEVVDAVGGGVAQSALQSARRLEQEPGAQPYFDALDVEAAWVRGDCAAAAASATRAIQTLPIAESLFRGRLMAIAGACAARRGDEENAAALLATGLARDPGVFRRLELRLPVTVQLDGSRLAEKARGLIERSPRFDVGAGRFRVVLRGGPQAEACLLGPTGEQFACAHVNLPLETSDAVGARLLVEEFHKAAFALKADLSQADLTSLDGSPTAARADHQVQSLIDLLGNGSRQ